MMNNEELERKMEFIVNHQAQFVVDIEKLHEWQSRFGIEMDKLRESQRETEQIVNRLAYVTNVGFKEVNSKIDALVNCQIDTDEKIKALADSHKQTEEALRKLSATVDRSIRNRSNGTG